jgi:predicted RNA-binding Zn-ribbon protein involved in translation (DUF1610 family)
VNFEFSRRKSFWLWLSLIPVIAASTGLLYAVFALLDGGFKAVPTTLLLVCAPILLTYFFRHWMHYKQCKQASETPDLGLCQKCGYELHGSILAKRFYCPECGYAIPLKDVKQLNDLYTPDASYPKTLRDHNEKPHAAR